MIPRRGALWPRLLCAAALLAFAGPGCTDDNAPASDAVPTATPAAPLGGWPLPGQDYANTRAAVGSGINAGNVGRLARAWTAPVEGGLTTVPIVVDDTVYVQDRLGGVRALDLATGAVRWSYPSSGINVGPNGVAVASGSVFGVTTDDVFALDAATGVERWRTKLTRTETDGIDIQPIVFDGRVYASTVPVSVQGQYAGGDRGVIHALDAETGQIVWTWDTVDSEDVWGNPALNSGGGAWYPPAIDPAAGIVYFGTANPAPFPGTAAYPNGSSRPGANLYTDSAVALDAETGELRWYHQVHPHDLFDRDQVHTMLVDLPGEDERILVSAGKGGHVLGLDLSTGELLWDTRVGRHKNDDLTELAEPTEIMPGTFGGVLTPPASAEGMVYVVAVNAPQTLVPNEEDYFGADLGVMDGEIVAIDASDGSIAWFADVPGDPTGGATVINDLVLTATLQGRLFAFHRASGERAWELDAGGGVIGWMAVAGDTIIVPVGNATPPHLLALRLTAE